MAAGHHRAIESGVYIIAYRAAGSPHKRHLLPADLALLEERATLTGMPVAQVIEDAIAIWCADERRARCETGNCIGHTREKCGHRKRMLEMEKAHRTDDDEAPLSRGRTRPPKRQQIDTEPSECGATESIHLATGGPADSPPI